MGIVPGQLLTASEFHLALLFALKINIAKNPAGTLAALIDFSFFYVHDFLPRMHEGGRDFMHCYECTNEGGILCFATDARMREGFYALPRMHE